LEQNVQTGQVDQASVVLEDALDPSWSETESQGVEVSDISD